MSAAENGRAGLPVLRGLRDTSMIQHDVNMADPGGTDSDRPPLRVLKFELQLYKLRDGEYCIDVQVRPACQLWP